MIGNSFAIAILIPPLDVFQKVFMGNELPACRQLFFDGLKKVVKIVFDKNHNRMDDLLKFSKISFPVISYNFEWK